MADIEIVQPVEGAARVTFNYTAASDALDALSSMGTKLNEQAEARVAPRDEAIVNWVGYFRDEFDRAWNLLQLRFGAAVEGASMAQLQIYTAISDANEEQRRLNREADQARQAAANQAPQPANRGSGDPN
jgi:hypothetical protein